MNDVSVRMLNLILYTPMFFCFVLILSKAKQFTLQLVACSWVGRIWLSKPHYLMKSMESNLTDPTILSNSITVSTVVSSS